MKTGDLVQWIGFPDAAYISHRFRNMAGEVGKTGIIIKVYDEADRSENIIDIRYDVLWSDGSIGTRLFPKTLKVIQ